MSARSTGIFLLCACIVGAGMNTYLATTVAGPWNFLNGVAAGMCLVSGGVMGFSLWRNWRWL